MLLVTASASCVGGETAKTGELVLSYQPPTQALKESIGGAFEADARSVLVEIKNADGELYYSDQRVPLHGIVGSQISEPLALPPGSYMLTAFLVLDAEDLPLYASPVEGSNYDYLVDRPLPLPFEVTAEMVSTVRPEVITVDEPLESYGYAGHSFDVVDTLTFYLAVFIEANGEMHASEFALKVTATMEDADAGERTLYEGLLSAEMQRIRVRRVPGAYTVTVSREGYAETVLDLSADELLGYARMPLIVVLKLPMQDVVLEFPALRASVPSDHGAPVDDGQRSRERADAAAHDDGAVADVGPTVGGRGREARGSSARKTGLGGSELETHDVEGTDGDGPDRAQRYAVITLVGSTAEGGESTVVWNRKVLPLTLGEGDNGQAAYFTLFQLPPGEFRITELFITEGPTAHTLEAVPQAGFDAAQGLNDPLPIELRVEEGESVRVAPETVVLTRDSGPADFGYEDWPRVEGNTIGVFAHVVRFGTGPEYLDQFVIQIESCVKNCRNEDEAHWIDTCELVEGYHENTEGYDKLCPRVTPRHEPGSGPVPDRRILLPAGATKWRVTVYKRHYTSSEAVFHYSQMRTAEFSDPPHHHTEYFTLEAVDPCTSGSPEPYCVARCPGGPEEGVYVGEGNAQGLRLCGDVATAPATVLESADSDGAYRLRVDVPLVPVAREHLCQRRGKCEPGHIRGYVLW
jgi:hypothetical protein